MVRPSMSHAHHHPTLWRRTQDASEVHVWSQLAGEPDDLATDLALLDDAELARAQRFRFSRDRVRFVRRHAFTRRVLARYLGADPTRLSIRVSTKGRPHIHPPCGVSFNVSQADDLTVVAVARGRQVGVDIERLRDIDDAAGIAEGFFSRQEAELLRSVPPTRRSSAFLKLWTRKESFVKALGDGLSIPLDTFTVLMPADDEAGRPQDSHGDLPFVFAPLDCPPGYVGTITLPGSRVTIRSMDAVMVNE